MYFEVSARTGNNITMCFNQIAKKLTGIETNPIQQSEIKNNQISGGFTLGGAGGQGGNGDGNTETGQKKKRKGCGC